MRVIARCYGSRPDIRAEVTARERDLARHRAGRDIRWNGKRDLLVLIPVEGIYLDTDPGWKTVRGYAPSEVVGLRFDALAHPDDMAAVRLVFEEVLQDKAATNFPARRRHRIGSYRDFERNVELQWKALFASIRDVDERNERKLALAETRPLCATCSSGRSAPAPASRSGSTSRMACAP